MASLDIEVLTKKLVKPSVPTPYHLQKLKLSAFDQLAPKVFSSTVIFYYSGSGKELEEDGIRASDIVAEKCARLEKSLSEALVRFYPFAGRFIADEVSIDCSDQGVEFWQARVSCRLSEFLKRGRHEVELMDKLLPWEIPPAADSATSPQLAVQVSTFDDGGIAVGWRISHVLADAATASLLIKAWAAASRDGINISPTQNEGFLDELAHAFPAKSSLHRFNFTFQSTKTPPLCKEANKIVTRRFLITSELLTRCTEHMAINAMTNGERKPSKVVAVFALVWKALMGTSVAKHGYLRDSALSIAMNLRDKVSLENKRADTSFGNFYMSVIVTFTANKTYNDVGLYDLAILIRKAIADTKAKINACASRDDLMTMLMNTRMEVSKWIDSDSMDVCFFSSLYGVLPLYETDFGWGKPSWASMGSQACRGVCLMDSSEDDDGIELLVSLKQAEMLAFKLETAADV